MKSEKPPIPTIRVARWSSSPEPRADFSSGHGAGTGRHDHSSQKLGLAVSGVE